jgi:SAM-dependent methyltransferase
MPTDPTARFSDRVEHYVRYRPSYPAGVLPLLERVIGLTAESVIADLGSGTGISAELFLRHGNTVYGVEPNDAMRHAAQHLLQGHPNFRSVNGRAEATTLPDASVDVVVAAQAFHWFGVAAAREEVRRILRPDGWCVLLWNTRRLDSTPFLRAYEALLQRFGTDYREIRHTNIATPALQVFFGGAHYQRHALENHQELDLAGIRGLLLSSSYVPAVGHPDHASMLAELERIVAAHGRDGRVTVEYETEVYVGRVQPHMSMPGEV